MNKRAYNYLLSSVLSPLRWPDDLCTTRGECDLSPWLWPWPALWKRPSAIRLNIKPTMPTYSNESGSLTVASPVVNRCIASTMIAKQSARRNTELTNAPRTSALIQPYVFFGDWIFDIYNKLHYSAYNKTVVNANLSSMIQATLYVGSTLQFLQEKNL